MALNDDEFEEGKKTKKKKGAYGLVHPIGLTRGGVGIVQYSGSDYLCRVIFNINKFVWMYICTGYPLDIYVPNVIYDLSNGVFVGRIGRGRYVCRRVHRFSPFSSYSLPWSKERHGACVDIVGASCRSRRTKWSAGEINNWIFLVEVHKVGKVLSL